jgi:hypothetical protein
MSFPRRSARIAAKNAIIPPTTNITNNPTCNLSNSHVNGSCYEQDKRPKYVSKTKKVCDPLVNVPLLVNALGYVDGIGYQQKQSLCFTRYCPSCQTYWKERLGM